MSAVEEKIASLPPYPTGPRFFNRVGSLGLVVSVLALLAAAVSVSAVVMAIGAAALSAWGTRRPGRPTFAAWVGVVVSAAAFVVSIAVAAGR